MSFGPVELRFLVDTVVDSQRRHAGEVARLDYLLACALIERGDATPIITAPLPELRPVRGRFVR